MAAVLYLILAGVTLPAVRRVVRISFAACIVLTLLPLLPTARAILTGGVYGPVDLAYSSQPLESVAAGVGIRNLGNPSLSDGYAQTIPWYTAVRHSLWHGQWPLWNPFEFCGGILLAAVQSAPFHPIYVLSYLLPPPDARTFIATATFFLAALSMFLFAKELTGGDSASLVAAAGWMFTTHLVFFVGSALGTSTAVLPLLLLAAGRVALRPGFTSGMFLVAALTLLVLAGHSEAMLQFVSLAIVWFFFVLFGSRKAIREAIVAGVFAGLVTLSLCAVMIAPHVEALTQTEEFQSREKKVTSVSRTSFASLRHRTLSTLLPFIDGQPGVEVAQHPPDLNHNPVAFAYAGALLFGPAVYSLVWLQRRRDVRFFSVLLLFGILAGIRMPGLIDLLNHLPGFSLAVNDRMLCFAALSIVVLAAIGLDEWSRDASSRMAASLFMVGLSIIAVMIVIGPDLLRRGLHFSFIRVHATRAALPLFIAGVAALHHSRRLGLPVFLALLLLQRGGETAGMQSTVGREAFYPRFEGLELMTSPQPPSRVIGVGSFLTPNTATMYGLEDARGYQAMTLSRYTDMVRFWSTPQSVWSNRVDDLSAPFLSLMNVRWAIAAPTTTIPDGWAVRLRTPAYVIAENLRVLPRAFAPALVHLIATDSDSQAVGRCRNFAAEGWIETRGPTIDQPNGAGAIRTFRDGNRLLLEARMDAPGWVVVSESAWKGWRATMDGRSIPLRIANHAFLALYLPAGNHHVRLEYRPQSFVIALVASLLTALALAGFAIARSFAPGSLRRQFFR